jgi:EAL domain-containing protein (putative c-di-GMP-specific phosphodiesterase class I)
VIDTLSKPYKVDGREVTISCSVGIALYPDKCRRDKLIARADAAMYAAKRAGGSRTASMRPWTCRCAANFDLLRDLRQALAKNELELFYQPKIDAPQRQGHRGRGAAALAAPDARPVMPDRFIPLAERFGLIGPLGNWVIEEACRQAAPGATRAAHARRDQPLGAPDAPGRPRRPHRRRAASAHRIHPSLLTCEITESAAMEDTGTTQETFRRLGELGVHLSIDDFGTGYSSLSYLRQLPAEELKIDRSFVKDLEHSADARAVVDAVVKLAHALGLKVVAEGVETSASSRSWSSSAATSCRASCSPSR